MGLRQKVKRLRNCVYKASADFIIPVLQRAGVQVRPTGYFPSVLAWSQSGGIEQGEIYEEYEPPVEQDHPVSRALMDSPCGECFRDLKPGTTTRQYRLSLSGARVYGARGVIVHQTNRIFSEITYEYATEPKHFSFWNDVRVPIVNETVKSLGVAHSMSAHNYSHWLMEVVPQLIKLKEDLDSGDIERIYVSCEKGFQKEWLDIIGIDQDKVLQAGDEKHIHAEKMVVYSMPMRNCEFSEAQIETFKSLVDPRWEPMRNRKIFVGREGGNRSFALSNADLKSVVEDCGYEYVLMEQHTVREKIRYFAEATTIAGPHGGGFGGILFSSHGTEFREIHSPLIPNLCYWRIASSCGLKYDATYAHPESGADSLKGVQKRLRFTEKELREFLNRKISS